MFTSSIRTTTSASNPRQAYTESIRAAGITHPSLHSFPNQRSQNQRSLQQAPPKHRSRHAPSSRNADLGLSQEIIRDKVAIQGRKVSIQHSSESLHSPNPAARSVTSNQITGLPHQCIEGSQKSAFPTTRASEASITTSPVISEGPDPGLSPEIIRDKVTMQVRSAGPSRAGPWRPLRP